MQCCRQLILFLNLLCPLILAGQTTNPFDLTFRLVDTVSSVDSIPAGMAIDSPAPTDLSPAMAIDTPIATPPVETPAVDDRVIPQGESGNPFDLVVVTDEETEREKIAEVLPETTEEEKLPELAEKNKSEEPPTESADLEAEEPPAPVGTRDDTRQRPSTLLLLLLFGLVLLILTWVVNLNRGFLRNIYRAALNENLSALLQREQRFSSQQYSYYLVYLIFFISLGLFIFFSVQYSDWNLSATRITLASSIGFVLAVYLLRHISLGIIARTFPVSSEMNRFNFNVLLYNILCGLVLIPIDLFLAFGPESLYNLMIILGLISFGVLYLMRQFRGLVISSHLISSNWFHFFIYLCTIEILPVLVLIKFFHN